MPSPDLVQAVATVPNTESWIVPLGTAGFGIICALIGLLWRSVGESIKAMSVEITGQRQTLTEIKTTIGNGSDGLVREVQSLRTSTHAHATEITVMKARHEEEDRAYGAVDRRGGHDRRGE